MQSFNYTRPTTAQEAVKAFADAGAGARFVAGGTNLYDLMKLNIEQPLHLVDVTSIDGLDALSTDGGRIRLGALVPMSAAATNERLARDYPVLVEALWKAASQQIRNMATVGGNLLQRTRCMYFRNGADGAFPCNKREPGSGCAAIGGLDSGQAVLGASDACNAVSPGDWPVALTALEAIVEVQGPQGVRSFPVAELYRLPEATPHLEFSLAPGELITAIEVPQTSAGRFSTYHKVRDRESYAFALASAAVALEIDGDRIIEARIALGGVATRPWRAKEAEQALVGQIFTLARAREAGAAAFWAAKPGRHNGFKIELGARTVADAIEIAFKRSRA